MTTFGQVLFRGGTRARSLARALDWGIVGAALVLVVLCVVAFEPVAPDPSLDGSWRYAVAAAAMRRMAFGRDFVFTAGPLGMLYSGFRLPSQDALYLGFGVLLSAGLVAGFLLSAAPKRRGALLLLPAAVAASVAPDAVFFVLPFTLLLGCSNESLPTAARGTALALVAGCDGVLPLVKGTMSLPVAGCTALAVLLLARDRSPLAVALPALTGASALGAWLIAGQRLEAIPAFVRSQSEIAAGYTNAMSVFGPVATVLVFMAAAILVVLLAAEAAAPNRRLAVGLGSFLMCFVAFKAGFVRDDGHSLIAASALLLLGLLVFVHDPRRRAVLALAIGIGGWAWVASGYVAVSPAAVASRLDAALSRSARSIANRVRHPERTFAAFERERVEIASGFEPAPAGGSYDIYPLDQTLILATALPWAPRPVPQSYSAYTPVLAAMDAAHVEGPTAADNLVFDVGSLDDRYPALDDGPSWPAILSRYDYRGLVDGAARLRLSALAHPATIGAPILRRPIAFNEEVVLPPGGTGGVWATLDFEPTLAGRLASALFKSPLLFIDVTYPDGGGATYRMVAGEGAAGFLLSPTIGSVRDFAALKLGHRDLLTDREVRSFRLRQDSAYPFWGTQVAVTLSPFTVSPDPADVDDLRGHLVPGPALTGTPAGGECAIDAVADKVAGDGPVHVALPDAAIEGWAMLSTAGRTENAGVTVAVTDAAGRTLYAPAVSVRRPDLDRYFALPMAARVGFSAVADLRGLHGTYGLRVVQDGPDGPVACPSGAAIVVP